MNELVVRGDGNCFYREISLWNENKKVNHGKVRRLTNQLIAEFPDLFQPHLFSSPPSVSNHLQKCEIDGTWAETVDTVACATLFQRRICTYSMFQGSWFCFDPVWRTLPSISIAKKQCKCPITLACHDFHPASHHFNLLLPSTGNCCDFNTLKVHTNDIQSLEGSTSGKKYA